MADRDLTVSDVMKLYAAHGCGYELTRKNFLKIWRGQGATYRIWMQHLHKGIRDSLRRNKVHESRVRLGFDAMNDDQFYAPLD